ncbi:UDP-N-acetylmuramoyl-L-alanyl-D-glutamate--2,6-diaminopimelate ligase [Patescibacteria group bacterium]|nr:UDP-N-acetylmuramoyl-L-alanyl-D-glutamate--2,6-diaminopimelate ligase [Patescibacteria group bacterium]
MKEFLRKIIPAFVFDWYHFGWALLGALIYRFPAKKLKIIGVTGTNGKTTVVSLLEQIFTSAGNNVASLSSIEFKIKNKAWLNDLKMTMPGRMKIQRFLRQAVDAGCDWAILEATSEGIKQFRHRFIDFEAAVLTNLTPEHIERHGSFENYRQAKGKLFSSLKKNGKAIINLDDPSAGYFLKFKAAEKWGYGVDFKSEEMADYSVKAEDCKIGPEGISFKMGQEEFKLNLLGKFNLYNALTAATVALAERIPLSKIKVALEKAKGAPGRLEFALKSPFFVIVDYAHTPDALEKVYQAIKESFSRQAGKPASPAGKLIGVLGSAGGGRDRWKRPEMGEIAEKYLDEIIITNEDPYDEDPSEIINEVAGGIKEKKVKKILDRREAISLALRTAKEGDIVIITGKGCEPWLMAAGGRKIPWDDRKVVQEEISKLREIK